MRDNGNNLFTSKGCTGSIRQSESAGTNRGHFSAEKSDFRGMERLWCVQQRRCIPRKMGCPDPRGGEERRATTLAPPPPEPAPECHTAREPGSQGNTERRAWVRHFQGLGTTTITTTDISTTMVTTIVTTKIETTKNLDHNPDHDRHHDHHHVHHYDHRDEHA